MVISTVATLFGVRILRKPYVDAHTKMGLYPSCCPVCGKYIKDGDTCSLLTNGGVLFENVIVHDSHFGSDDENENLIRNMMINPKKCK